MLSVERGDYFAFYVSIKYKDESMMRMLMKYFDFPEEVKVKVDIYWPEFKTQKSMLRKDQIMSLIEK